jgi:plasmid stabilization system protein ParE
MTQVRLHPQVYLDIDKALGATHEQFGPEQVRIYERLILDARKKLAAAPKTGQKYAELGPDVYLLSIAKAGIDAPYGYIYRAAEDGTVSVVRLVHLARYLPDLIDKEA